jgi:hypothetical protein
MKQITKVTLNQLRKTQQKEFYGSEAKAMFVDGVFNSNNWNGGDGLIRQYFYDFVYQDQKAAEIECKYGNLTFSGDLIVSHNWFDDQNYATIILKGWLYVDETDEYVRQVEDIAYFTWYKSRGTIENAMYNGKPMTEAEYLFVLNALQETGFEFDLR